MKFPFAVYFAGMATVVAAISAGFGGGIMLTSATAPKEPSSGIVREQARGPQPPIPLVAASQAPTQNETTAKTQSGPSTALPVPSSTTVEQALATVAPSPPDTQPQAQAAIPHAAEPAPTAVTPDIKDDGKRRIAEDRPQPRKQASEFRRARIEMMLDQRRRDEIDDEDDRRDVRVIDRGPRAGGFFGMFDN